MFELAPFDRNHRTLGFYDPFREFDSMLRDGTLQPFKTDIKEDGSNYILEADLPGCNKEDIKVDIDGDTVTIEAQRHSEAEEKDKQGRYVRCERSYGSYRRSFDASGIDTEAISAAYEDGVLKLTLPKKAPVAPTARRLEIK